MLGASNCFSGTRMCNTCSKNGDDCVGYGSKDFRINDAPRVGVCDVVPDTGVAYETLFNLNCSTPFSDAEIPLTYEIGYRTSPISNINWLYQGTLPK